MNLIVRDVGCRRQLLSAVVYVIASCCPCFLNCQIIVPFNEAKIRLLQECSSQADEFAPYYSPSDSTIEFTRAHRKGITVYSFPLRSLKLSTQLTIRPIDSGTMNTTIYKATNGSIQINSQIRRVAGELRHLLVSATLSQNMTTTPQIIEQVQDGASSSLHPALSPDGRTLVFCSNRNGGEGGTDLWISSFSNGQWNIPLNAGKELNSVNNEITPCFFGNDTLLFASNGFGGKGGYDLFMTIRRAGEWLAPIPLSSINSSQDETDPCILPDGSLIFVSNRVNNQRDLYRAVE